MAADASAILKQLACIQAVGARIRWIGNARNLREVHRFLGAYLLNVQKSAIYVSDPPKSLPLNNAQRSRRIGFDGATPFSAPVPHGGTDSGYLSSALD